MINLGRGEPVLVLDFVKSLEKLAGKQAPLSTEPMMKADVTYTFANIDKARFLISVQRGAIINYARRTSVSR